jgi:hypothetical protein
MPAHTETAVVVLMKTGDSTVADRNCAAMGPGSWQQQLMLMLTT